MEGQAQPGKWARSPSTSTGPAQSAGLRITGTQNETRALLVLEGELDVAGAPFLLEYLQLTNAGLPENISLDLAGLDYVDSSGLGVLVTMHKRAQAEGTKFTLSAPSKRFLKVLEVTGLRDYFDFDTI